MVLIDLKKLQQELGQLDKRRREVLKLIKSSPEHGKKMIKDYFDLLIKNTDISKNKGIFITKNGVGEKLDVTYYKDRVFWIKDVISIECNRTMTGMFYVKYNIQHLDGVILPQSIEISIDKDLRNQVFHNAVELIPYDCKIIKNEIAELEIKQKNALEIAAIEKQVKELNEKLLTLKGKKK